MKTLVQLETAIPGLHASASQPLPFAPSLDIRAFLLRRERGNLLVYSVDGLESQAPAIEELGGVARRYLNHWHESTFVANGIDAPIYCHENDRASVAEKIPVAGSFSRRHMLADDFEVIPTPGHTPGATAFLWENGEHRFLFSGDTISLSEGEWIAAVLESSDRAAYIESLALLRELDFDVLVPWLATRGQLPAEHGFPARLVVPGFYGTNSVKWLTRMTLAETRATGAFTTRWYNDPVLDAAGEDTGKRVPVWAIAPDSVIVSPAPGEAIPRDVPRQVWGWAWADRGIDRVQVSVDDGATWRAARLEPRAERAWQQFALPWRPAGAGAVVLCSRATAPGGETQPESGRRNAIHRVEVDVV